ncbi:protein D1 isoform X5 [Bemisia tabaci]|uniref:protein D1 isoform X5 n=1 Tax=Bemisia tabaci TaxID=7038 RepID=UPI003B27F3F2
MGQAATALIEMNFSECSMHKQAKCLIITICALLNGCASQKPETSSQNILTDTTVSSLEDALYDFEIIPDVLEDEPPHVIKVKFGDKVVNLGNKFKLCDLQLPPSYVSWTFDKGALYTLVFAGVDYPVHMQHQYREYPHWVMGNIPGDSFLAGETIFSYHDPAKINYLPGFHRFVFTLYKQNCSGPVKFQENLPAKSCEM